MIVYAVDDEPLLLQDLRKAILEVKPEAELHSFSRCKQVLAAMDEGLSYPDVVFLDIELPGMGGIELAKKIKLLSPKTWVVFVTGFTQYAMEAWNLHVKGYLLKPVTAEKIREEFEIPQAIPEPDNTKSHVRIQTFGNFEVFYDGIPMRFKYNKTKELLAYLVDRKGAICESGEIMAALWEDESLEKGSYFRNVRVDLLHTLSEYNCEDIIIKQKNQLALIPEKVSCDYYKWQEGDVKAINEYRGEYMSQYSWSEITLGKLSDI